MEKRIADRAGLAIIAACVFGFSGLFGAAIVHDSRIAAKAKPVRLIGQCSGEILAAMEESDFPAGCAWIEPIKTESN